MSVWPLMERRRISQPSSRHRADSCLHARCAALRRLQSSLVYLHVISLTLNAPRSSLTLIFLFIPDMNVDLFLFSSFSERSVSGSPKWRPVSGAHPRGACSSRPADRGSHTGCSSRGKVQKVCMARQFVFSIDTSFISAENYYNCTLLFFDFLRAKGITGRDVTPFILKMVNELTEGKSLQASIHQNI